MRDSIWFRTLPEADLACLDASDPIPGSADVVVIGAGLVGLACGYYLTRAGVGQVCVVDRGSPAGEASGANAGGLWFAHQCLDRPELAPLAVESRRLYGELSQEFEFDLSWAGALLLLEDEADFASAASRIEAVRAAGFEADLLDAAQLAEAEPELASGPAGAILFPRDGQVNPVKLAAAWTRAIREAGGVVCSGVDVQALGSPIETSAGSISAGAAVIAAGAWTPLLTKALGWAPPIRPIRGVLMALPPQPVATLRHTVLGDDFYWWQIASGHLVGGGSEEDAGFENTVEPAVVDSIRQDLARRFPQLTGLAPTSTWSGLRPFCADGRPVIGPAPGCERLWVAAGHFRKGVMLAPVTGKIIADLIVDGRSNDMLEQVRPDRFAHSAPG